MVRGDRGDDWDDGCTDSERDQAMDESVQRPDYTQGLAPTLTGVEVFFFIFFLFEEVMARGNRGDDWEDARLILSRFPELLLVARY